MRRSTVRYGRSPQVDHDMGTGSPLLGYSRSSIAQLNRSHPYSSRWATVAFYLEQDTPPSSSEDPNASSAPTVRWRPHLLEVASRRTSSHWAPIRLVLIAPFRGCIVSDKMIRNFGDHSANQRTFLAWVRTAIAVMAFGFLVEKFDLFMAAWGIQTGS